MTGVHQNDAYVVQIHAGSGLFGARSLADFLQRLLYNPAPAKAEEYSMEPMINIALRAARKAGENVVRASDDLDRIDVVAKGVNDFVSEVDINAEREIIYHLQKAYPDHAILGEETGLTGSEDAQYQWIIDPLDGTTNYARGIPHYAISIACMHRGKLEHAVIVDPVRREEFTASRGRGAQLNGRRLRVSKRNSLEGALLGTGIPFKGH
jgi:myo-inositol-1(or 4)-monophosphatase